jgi:hypothetical protein
MVGCAGMGGLRKGVGGNLGIVLFLFKKLGRNLLGFELLVEIHLTQA